MHLFSPYEDKFFSSYPTEKELRHSKANLFV